MSLPLSMLICLSMAHLCMGDQHVEEIITAKTMHPLGEWTKADPSAKDVQDAVQFAVKTYNTESESKRMFKLVSFTNPKSQVTNKIQFKFDALLVKTKCFKSENHDLDSCSLKKRHMKCLFIVTLDPRTNTHEMEKRKCKKQIEKA